MVNQPLMNIVHRSIEGFLAVRGGNNKKTSTKMVPMLSGPEFNAGSHLSLFFFFGFSFSPPFSYLFFLFFPFSHAMLAEGLLPLILFVHSSEQTNMNSY